MVYAGNEGCYSDAGKRTERATKRAVRCTSSRDERSISGDSFGRSTINDSFYGKPTTIIPISESLHVVFSCHCRRSHRAKKYRRNARFRTWHHARRAQASSDLRGLLQSIYDYNNYLYGKSATNTPISESSQVVRSLYCRRSC